MNENLLNFTGKVILITGASSGIGRATALAFARQGAKVVIGDMSDVAAQTVAAITELGGEAIYQKTNVANATEVQALLQVALDTYGTLDFAFNNSGILPVSKALGEMSEEDFNQTIDIDLKGVFLCLKYELAYMASVGKGAIVNTASVAGLVSDPAMSPYTAAKHGVVGLTKAAALDYATQGIRINAIAPGLVATAMTKRWMEDPATKTKLLENSPIGRAAEPEEIAGAVLFLCSDLASFITGHTLVIDGGQTAH
jgi:NAD(P)-dependent dehydrogenase (short-subunit alcohol dehydrogenase family)